MDRLILDQKLESLRRCVTRIDEKRPADFSALVTDDDLQDILVLNLTRAVQLCVDIGSHVVSASDGPAPQTMGEVFDTLKMLGVISTGTCQEMRKAVGFRNIAVHNYETIDWRIVFALCEKAPVDFRKFASEVLTFVGDDRG